MLEDQTSLRNLVPNELKAFINLLCRHFGCKLLAFNLSSESREYSACSLKLNRKQIEYRTSKITPTKTGQFVTIWKRDKDGETAPFDISDNIDFIIISSKSGDNLGYFIFPKSILAEKGIISQNGKAGKRGIRVYPPWDVATSKQAQRTQAWQMKYFLTIANDNSFDVNLAGQLLSLLDIERD